MAVVTLNQEKNGIEIRFENKPESSVIEALKAHGFRWSSKQHMWYAKQDSSRLSFAASLSDVSSGSRNDIKNNEKGNKLDLWALTRTDEIRNNYAETKLHNVKEIAKIIRTHIKSRFPMCKFSVRSDYNSIDLDLLSSPFAKDSDELKAIVHYVFKFADSWNYDNSDSMTDYFDKNFYGVYESSILSWQYEQTSSTEEIAEMCKAFQAALADFEEAERQRKIQEQIEYGKRMEQERIESEKYHAERDRRHALIESGAVVKDVYYFVYGCVEPVCNKLDKVSEIEAEEKKTDLCNCEIVRELHLGKELYEFFSDALMDDYSFLAGMGGHKTYDRRVNSDTDFLKMSKEERETVQWVNASCIAVFCDGEMKLIVNPEGHNYARYAYLVNEDSVVLPEYSGSLGLTDSELEQDKQAAETIEDASVFIIEQYNLLETWNKENYELYKSYMREWLRGTHMFKFSKNVIRQIGIPELKEALYDICENPIPAENQFANASLNSGDKFTLIKFSEFGSLVTYHGKFIGWEVKKWAQYDNNICLSFVPENKRGVYCLNLYNEFILIPGYVEIPEDLLWETIHFNGMVCRKSRYLSCDRKQLDSVLDYFVANGMEPVINTYKPVF